MAERTLPWICLLTIARSGTTHLVRLMDALQDVHVIRNEWLDVRGVTWAQPEQLARFSKAIGHEIKTYKDPILNAWVRANIGQTLSILQDGAARGDRATAIKLFEDHLTSQEFDTHFLSKPDTKFLILERRPIDCFISLRKAMVRDEWVGRDTTGLKIELDAQEFLAWHAIRRTWFDGMAARLEAAGRPYGRLDYDRDIAQGSHHMLDRLIEELRVAGFETRRKRGYLTKLALRRHASAILGWEPHPDLGAVKQDRAANAADKVGNWDDFAQTVEQTTGGLDVLERYRAP